MKDINERIASVLAEFDERIDADRYKRKKYETFESDHLVDDPDVPTLLDLESYPESCYELDAAKVRAFIEEKLREALGEAKG